MARSDAPGRVPSANRLLAALPRQEYDRLLPHLETVALPARAVLHEAREPIAYVHFPCSGVVSLLCPPEEKGEGIEVGVVGREGVAGLTVFLGAEAAPTRCVVQVAGSAQRMRADDFRAYVQRDGVLHELLLRYTHAFLAQVSQSVACNALHPVGQRLARWILSVRSRLETDQFPLTHAFLATMLGVRRASVSEAAHTLQQAGLIRYGRGQVTVLDRAGLDTAACGCQRLVQAELDRLPC
jgi:CRP-like cAMP-binding protein